MAVHKFRAITGSALVGLASALILAAGGPGAAAAIESTTVQAASAAPAGEVAAAKNFNKADVMFAQHMLAHHEHGREMTRMAMKKASTPKVKALVVQIAKDQNAQTKILRSWLAAWGQSADAAMDDMQGMQGMNHDEGMEHMDGMGHMQGMDHAMTGTTSEAEMKGLAGVSGKKFDDTFLAIMIRHHHGAIAMANTEKATGRNAVAKGFATNLAKAQRKEIVLMKKLMKG